MINYQIIEFMEQNKKEYATAYSYNDIEQYIINTLHASLDLPLQYVFKSLGKYFLVESANNNFYSNVFIPNFWLFEDLTSFVLQKSSQFGKDDIIIYVFNKKFESMINLPEAFKDKLNEII